MASFEYSRLPLFSAFLAYLVDQRSFSTLTRKAYATDLTQLFEWIVDRLEAGTVLSEQVVTAAILGQTPESLALYFKGLEGLLYVPQTTNRKKASTRSFFKWACAQGHLQENPAVALRMTRMPTPSYMSVAPEALDRLCSAPDEGTELGLRDRAILRVLCDTSVRTGELVAFNVGDFSDGSLRVSRSGKRTRVLKLHERTRALLQLYLQNYRRGAAPDEAMFTNKHGSRLSARSLRRNFDRYLKRSGLSPAIRPMDLRHTGARSLLQDGTSRNRVCEVLGVRTPTTLRRISTASPSLNGASRPG